MQTKRCVLVIAVLMGALTWAAEWGHCSQDLGPYGVWLDTVRAITGPGPATLEFGIVRISFPDSLIITVQKVGKLQYFGPERLSISPEGRDTVRCYLDVAIPPNDTSGIVVELYVRGGNYNGSSRYFVTTGDTMEIYHSWPKPALLPYYDGAGCEIYIDHPFYHTLWKDEEFASFAAAIPVLMVHDVYLQHRTDCEARHKMIQALANGLYPTPWTFRGMKPIFEFVKVHEKYFDWNHTTPVRDVVLVRDMERSRAHDRIARESAKNAGEEHGTFDRFLSPSVGFYSLLLHAHVPMATLHPRMIEDRLDGYRVLCLANEMALNRKQLDAITGFVESGGGLIVTGQTSVYDEEGRRRPDFGLAQLLGAHYRGLVA